MQKAREQISTLPWGIAIGLIALTVVVYAQTASFNFVSFDDPEYITENRIVRQGITLEGLQWAFTTNHASNWHPLTWLSLMLDRLLFGDWGGGFHLTNVFFHAINVLLLFAWLLRWTKAVWPSAFVAALFAVHPQHVESVAWITERKDVLSTFFGLLAILAYGEFVRRRSAQAYGGMLVAYGLSLLAKQMFVTLPVLLLLLDVWPLGRVTSLKATRLWPLVREKIPVFVLGGIFAIIVFYVQRTGGAVSELSGLPLSLRLQNAVYSTAVYLLKTFVPTGLAFYYPHPVDRLTVLQVVGSGAILLSVSFVVAICWRRAPYLLIGWLWFLITLAPVVGIIQIGKQGMADRYMYVPHIGIFLLVAWGASALMSRSRAGALTGGVIATAILVWFSVVAYSQVGTWRNDRALAERALLVTTDNPMALQVMGESYMKEDRPELALPYFENAAALTPTELTVLSSLAVAYEKTGDLEKAMTYYHQAAAHHPQSERALNNLGRALTEMGKLDEGIDYYRQVLGFKPDSVTVHNNLAMALSKKGDHAAARKHYEEAISLDPTNTVVRSNFASFLAQVGEDRRALQEFQEVVRQDPSDVAARGNFGTLLAKQGELNLAMDVFRDALAIDPQSASIRAKLARGYLALRQVDAAVREYRQALADDPQERDAANDLAWILATSEKFRDGKQAVQLLEHVPADETSPELLDTLAAAYAANGEFDKAVRIADRAAKQAEAAGLGEMANDLASRRELYRQKRPYRDPSLP